MKLWEEMQDQEESFLKELDAIKLKLKKLRIARLERV
jgi:hypothetical protein